MSDEKEVKVGQGQIHLHPKANTNGFKQNPQNIGKRKPSIKRAINKMLNGDGLMAISKKSVVREDDDNWYVKIPNEDLLATQLMKWAMGKNGRHSLKAIEMMMQRTDGLVLREKEVQDLYEVLKQYAVKDDHGEFEPPIQSEKEALDAAEEIDFEELQDL